jgi:hypothetical protein
MNSNRKWRICTGFTELNKCCLKDVFLLNRIDKIINFAACYEMMTLLDYSQVTIRYDFAKKTRRKQVSSHPSVCYMRMSKGLQNANPTFCRMTKVMLKDQVDRNIFTHVDYIIVVKKKRKLHTSLI